MTSRKSRKVKKYNTITFLWYFQTLFTAVEFFRISGGKKIAENTRTCALSVTSSFKNYIIFPDTFFVWNRAYVKLTDKTYCYCSRWSYSNQSFVCDMVLVNAVTWVETALNYITSSFKNYIIFPDTFFVWNRAYVKLIDKTYCYCSRWSYSNQSFVCDMVLVNAVTWVETALTRQWWGLLIKYFGAVYQACSRRIRSFECFRHCS